MKTLQIVLAAALIGAAPLASVAPALAQVGALDSSFVESAIRSSGSRATQVRQLHSVPSVGVVRIDVPQLRSLDTDADYNTYRTMAERHAAGISKLRHALAGNPVTRAALDRRGVDIGRVVGVMISSNGSLRLYVL